MCSVCEGLGCEAVEARKLMAIWAVEDERKRKGSVEDAFGECPNCGKDGLTFDEYSAAAIEFGRDRLPPLPLARRDRTQSVAAEHHIGHASKFTVDDRLLFKHRERMNPVLIAYRDSKHAFHRR